MLHLNNQTLDVILREEDLKTLLQDGVQKIVNQLYILSLPVIGSVSLMLKSLKTARVEISDDQIFLVMEAALEIKPKSSLLPTIFGTVRVESSLTFVLEEVLSVRYRVVDFQWLDGPKSPKGKPLRLMKSLSSQFLRNSDVIESIIEKRLSERLSSAQLEELIANLDSTLRIVGVPVHVVDLRVKLVQISIRPSSLLLSISYSAQISHDSRPLNVKVDFGAMYKRPVATLTVSEQFISKSMQSKIGQINVLLASSPLKVTNITIEIESRFIRTLIVPSRFTGKPIEVLLQLHYEPDLCLIELLDCQISANEDASVIIRGIFKLLSGRLEGAVERYFPLDPAEKMKSLIANLPNSGQIKFHFDDLRFLELQFLKGQLKVEMEYSMCIAMA